jgi:L-lactate dehydrogenase complex protein LldG
MSRSDPAREEILRRIRSALRDVSRAEPPDAPATERAYRLAGDESRAEIEARFMERVEDYKASVRRVPAAELPEAVARACASRGVRRLVVPADVPAAWTAPVVAAGVTLVRDDGARSPAELDACDGVLTGCALGIAQTGTIVLDGGATQGRRALTLVPDYHLCVVRVEQIVHLVPEAITRLETAAREHRPITFISGPSATSDIELSRVEGVHGPRTLEVLVVA